jgi:5'-AMP-activated protein kinase, catalytic alpha subunit
MYEILDPNPSTRISIQKIKESTWFRKGPRETRAVKEMTSENAIANAASIHVPARRKKNAHEDAKHLTVTSLNAFEIISLSAGFDLSGLFIEKERRKETRFTSDQPTSTIILKLEDVAKALNLRLRKKNNGVVKVQGRREGRNDVLQFDVEIFEITQSHYLVVMKQTGGDSLEYWKLLEEGIRPALKDSRLAWG